MRKRRVRVLASAAAAIAALLVACAASDEEPDPYEGRSCPNNEVLICWGGIDSNTGRIRDREPRVCQCRPPDRIAF